MPKPVNGPNSRLAAAASFLILAAALLVAGSARAQESAPGKFNKDGNILIADQFNNRVIEIDPSGNIVFSYGDGSSTAGPTSIVAPNDAERINGRKTLIAATGAPAGSEPSCPNGCPDNRVLIVNANGKILWQHGQAGVTGSGFNELSSPVQATYVRNARVLISDQGNQRVIRVKKNHNIEWQYGQTGVPGSDADQVNNPNSAELLDNGNVLIADEGNNRVIEVTSGKQIVWQYGTATGPSPLNAPAFASRLPNGNTLISDSGNNRAVEVTPGFQEVWQYVTSARAGSVAEPAPSRAIRLKNGNTLISDQFNHQVIEVDPTGQIVFSYGTIGIAGNGANELNAPYDAKCIGDYTGITKPPTPPGAVMGTN